jgi:hypothetical protein
MTEQYLPCNINYKCDDDDAGIEVQQMNVPVVTLATILNFIGAGVLVTQTGPTEATINIPGGGAVPLSFSFNDDVNDSIAVGTTAADGFIQVNMSVFDTVTAAQTSYRVTFGISTTGAAPDILQIDSDVPVTTVTVGGAAVGPNVSVLFTGTGPGNLIEVRYTVDTIARL